MNKWPVENPPPDTQLHINLRGAPLPKSANFDGPLNVLIELNGTGEAANTVAATRKVYDENYPETPIEPPPEEEILPLGAPISSGRKIVYEQGIIDPGIARRIK